MSHDIEMKDGIANFCYVGEEPWHGLGVKIPNDLTPRQTLEAAGLDWRVELVPSFIEKKDGTRVETGKSALVRSTDEKILTMVSGNWNPVQNEEAFDFFHDFVAAGDMTMETAGSLAGGTIVWALAKIKESFDLGYGKKSNDVTEAYALFTNPHLYGRAVDFRLTGVRVVCRNTIELALRSSSLNQVSVSHRSKFDPDLVKETMGIAKEKMNEYKEAARFLSDKRYTAENIIEYYEKLYPINSKKEESIESKRSRSATRLLELTETSPGHEYAPGTFWNAYNAVTYYADHEAGRNADTRLQSAWYGSNKKVKENALKLALEMAS